MKQAMEILAPPADEEGNILTKILDGHYLETKQMQNEDQDVAGEAYHPDFRSNFFW